MRSVAFISHGGGPLPLLHDPTHAELVAVLRDLPTRMARPAAIVVISAHWEAPCVTLTGSASPGLIYDYVGFPPESYSVSYPAPGAPQLAQRLHELLQQQGIVSDVDAQRGFDHGLFVPLKIMYPAADIPCVQLSLVNNLDPMTHLRIGQALAKLDVPDLLFLGSGFSFHNLRAFFTSPTPDTQAMNVAFEHWLSQTCGDPGLSEAERAQRLLQWEEAPAARYCHPRAEHLLPLHLCYGIAGTPVSEAFTFQVMGRWASAYLW